MIKTLAILAVGTGMGLVASNSYSEQRFYTEYKNEFNVDEFDYREGSTRNHLRLGSQWRNFYVEAGAVQDYNDIGTSYEAGYKFTTDSNFELKGKLEGVDFENARPSTKIETEVRYYFN